MMKKHGKTTPLRWLYAVLEKDRISILYLTLIRIASGLQGTLFAIVLKLVIDAGVEKDSYRLLSNNRCRSSQAFLCKKRQLLRAVFF